MVVARQTPKGGMRQCTEPIADQRLLVDCDTFSIAAKRLHPVLYRTTMRINKAV
jgi:hypothetical protein